MTSARKVRKDKGTEKGMEINMTPMIDVTFQLIIFFLCLKFKTLEGKLGAYLPKDSGPNPSKVEMMEKIDVHLYSLTPGTKEKEGNRFVWKDRRLKWRVDGMDFQNKPRFLRILRRIAKERLDPEMPGHPLPITLHAHPGVFYAEVTRTLDDVRFCGFDRVTFAGGYTR